MQTFEKDPAAVLDYGFDWRNWLAAAETITAHIVTVEEGITLGSTSESGGVVTAWISEGTADTRYRVACLITTSAGRTDERSFTLSVLER